MRSRLHASGTALACFCLAAGLSLAQFRGAGGSPAEALSAPATIVLPPQLVAGQPATLAVLSAEGRLAPGAAVEFSGGRRATTDATGRATFTAPKQPGVLLVKLPDTSASASAPVIASAAILPDGVQIHTFPPVVSLYEPFSVIGSGFRGEADANRAFLADQPALVLAASPAALVILSNPSVAPGPAELVIEVGGRSPGPVPIRLVALELVADKTRLAPGEKMKLRVRVQGTEQPLEVEARNLTPEIVRLPQGEVQRLTTRGGRNNWASLGVEGLVAGDFSIRLRLVRPAVGLPDTEAARQHLLAAHAIAPGGWKARLERLIDWLEENAQNAPKVRRELGRMLAEQPEGELGRRLEAAWQALLTK